MSAAILPLKFSGSFRTTSTRQQMNDTDQVPVQAPAPIDTCAFRFAV
jgi:hypothetical protein